MSPVCCILSWWPLYPDPPLVANNGDTINIREPPSAGSLCSLVSSWCEQNKVIILVVSFSSFSAAAKFASLQSTLNAKLTGEAELWVFCNCPEIFCNFSNLCSDWTVYANPPLFSNEKQQSLNFQPHISKQTFLSGKRKNVLMRDLPGGLAAGKAGPV